MLPNHIHFVVRYEQYQDWLREAKQERLIEAAKLSQVHQQRGLPRQTAHWLGSYVVKLGLKLQASRSNAPICCGNCCQVELKANASI
jgi:hypothetical protein